jgi:hypothetical protein
MEVVGLMAKIVCIFFFAKTLDTIQIINWFFLEYIKLLWNELLSFFKKEFNYSRRISLHENIICSWKRLDIYKHR